MRLVVDASVVVDLIGRFRPGPVEALLFAPNTAIAAPALLDVEVLQALRAQITAYDAAYVVLARQLDATLITRDARLARAPGLGIEILAP